MRWYGDHLYFEVPGEGLRRVNLATGSAVMVMEGRAEGILRAYFDAPKLTP